MGLIHSALWEDPGECYNFIDECPSRDHVSKLWSPRWHHWFMVGSSGGMLVMVGLWVSGRVTNPGVNRCLTVWKPKSRSSLVSDWNLIFLITLYFLFCFALSQIDLMLYTKLRATSNLCFSCFSLPSMHHRIWHNLCHSELPVSVVTGS